MAVPRGATAAERAVDVAHAVEGVEADVEPDVKDKGAPGGVEKRLDGGVVDANPRPDLVAHRYPDGLCSGDLELVQHLLQTHGLDGPRLVHVRHRLDGPGLKDADRQEERPVEGRMVEPLP